MNKFISIVIVLLSFSVQAEKTSSRLEIIARGITRQKTVMKYFLDKQSALVGTRTDGDISNVPRNERINDRNHQNQLFSGLKLNPYAINYSVIPDELPIRKILKDNGIKMKSVYYTIDLDTNEEAFGILADIGPGGQTTNGEFSIHQIRQMKLPVDKRTGSGGVDSNRLVTIIFPDSDKLIDTKYITQRKINEVGKKLKAKYDKIVGVENVIADIKNSTSHVDHYD